MREATNDYNLIIDNDNFIGIALGYDFCAEHEWGIAELKQRFGIPEITKKTLGIKNRSITICIDNLIFKKQTFKKRNFAILYTGTRWKSSNKKDPIPHNLENYKESILYHDEYNKTKDSIKTAWDGGSFGIGVMGEKEVKLLEDLYNAFLNKNIAITFINMLPKNPFSNLSLCVLIKDKIPQKFLDDMYNADKKYQDRIDYEKKIGMTKLKKKNKGNSYNNLYGHQHGYYMACSAKWIDYDNKENCKIKKKEYHTKYDIIYWINYSDDNNNYGYFSVEEIRAWLKGKKKLIEIRKENEEKWKN